MDKGEGVVGQQVAPGRVGGDDAVRVAVQILPLAGGLVVKVKTAVAGMVADGVSVVGGCCGTTPDYIRGLRALADKTKPVSRSRR